MRSIWRYISSLCAIVFCVVSIASADDTKELQKVVISYLPITNTLPFFVALDEGRFKAAGLDVEAVRFEAPNQIIDSLVSGRADIGAPGTAAGITLVANEKFPNALIVTALSGGSLKKGLIQESIVVRNDSPIKTLTDLKGKRLGIVPGIQWRTFSKFLLETVGLVANKDVVCVEVPTSQHVTALLSGGVDATLSLEPTGAIAEATGQAKRLLSNLMAEKLGDPFLAGDEVVTARFFKEHPEAAEKYLKIMKQATDDVSAQFEKYRPVLTKYTGVKEDQLSYVQPSLWRTYAEVTAEDLAGYQAIADLFVKEGVLKRAIKVEDVIYRGGAGAVNR